RHSCRPRPALQRSPSDPGLGGTCPQSSASRDRTYEMLATMRPLQKLKRFAIVAAVVVAIAATDAQQAAPPREPASNAAAILTWPVATREQYIAALDPFFLTRTVKAGTPARALDSGRPLAAFDAGGARAADFEKFLADQRVRGVLVLQDGRIRLERYVAPHSRT